MSYSAKQLPFYGALLLRLLRSEQHVFWYAGGYYMVCPRCHIIHRINCEHICED